ncbi:MAG: sugar efflux transporter [Opitutales bacterium]
MSNHGVLGRAPEPPAMSEDAAGEKVRPDGALPFLWRNPGLVGSAFVLGMALSFAAPFLSKWGTERVGLSPTAFGYFMTAVMLSGLAVNTYFARLSDTLLTRRQALVIAAACGSGGFACYALLTDPVLLLIAGCTLHAVASACFAQLFSHVREHLATVSTAASSMGLRMSVVRVCFSFAWTLGPALGATLLIAFGFRGLFLSAAGLYLIFLLGVLRVVPRGVAPRAAARPSLPPLWSTLRRPRIALSVLAFSAAFAALYINMLNLPLALTRTFGGKESDLGIVFGIGPLVEIPLMLWFGHLAGKGHTRRLIQFGFLITCLYFGGLFLAEAPWHVYLLQILSGAIFAILTNVAILYFQDLCPEQLGLSTALFSNSNAIGSVVGMLGFGYLVESFGHRGAFAACTAIAVFAFFVSAFFREEQRPQSLVSPH